MSSPNKSEIDEIFGIPVDGSHLDDSGSPDDAGYASVKKKSSDNDFDKEISRAHSSLSSVPSRKPDRPKKSAETVVAPVPAEVSAPAAPDRPAPNPVVEKKEMSKKKNEVNEVAHDEESPDGTMSDWQGMPVGGEWRLSHPDPRFAPFYENKKKALETWLLPGGKIKFQELNRELRESRMDLSDVVIGDIKNLFEKMRGVQALKDRVSYIISCCNEQYYPWKRAVEMFTGVLARIQYLKPAQRQGGLNAEHMADMERYLSELEALHFNAEHVSRNLESVYEMLSRQVTMSLPQRDIDNTEKKAQKGVSGSGAQTSSVSFLEQMDTVPHASTPSRGANAIFNKAKTGVADWE